MSERYSVWKFPLKLTDEFELSMPKGARMLRCGVQVDPRDEEELAQLWAVVNVDAPKVQRRFRLIGTGHPDEGAIILATFVDTILMNEGRLVLHLFDLGEA